MKFDKQLLWIRLLTIIGFALTVKLALIYYNANFDKYALSSFCSINDFVDCDGVAKTTTSQFIGIPLAYWGMFFYITVFFLTFVAVIFYYFYPFSFLCFDFLPFVRLVYPSFFCLCKERIKHTL